jgi:hypothetical protein
MAWLQAEIVFNACSHAQQQKSLARSAPNLASRCVFIPKKMQKLEEDGRYQHGHVMKGRAATDRVLQSGY